MTERMGVLSSDGRCLQPSPLAARAMLRPAARRLAAVGIGFAGGWAVLYGALMPFGLGLTLGLAEDCFAPCAAGAALGLLLHGLGALSLRSLCQLCALGAAVAARWLLPQKFVPAALAGCGTLTGMALCFALGSSGADLLLYSAADALLAAAIGFGLRKFAPERPGMGTLLVGTAVAAALGGLVTQAFFGLLYVFLYTALFRGENQAELAETITYVWLQQMFFRVLLMNDTELIHQVMTGGLAYAVLRPVDQYRFAFVRNMAQRHVNALMRLLPMIALQFLLPTVWRMQPPESLLALLQALVSLLIGVMNLCAIAGISGAILMQTMDNRGINAIITFISNAFAGNIIPLTLFPDSVQALIRYQPFAQSLDAPIRMYLHAQAAGEWALNIGVQLLWLMLLVALGRRMWRRQMNQLTIQGG